MKMHIHWFWPEEDLHLYDEIDADDVPVVEIDIDVDE